MLKALDRRRMHSPIKTRALAYRSYSFQVKARLPMLVSVSGCLGLSTLFIVFVTPIYSSFISFYRPYLLLTKLLSKAQEDQATRATATKQTSSTMVTFSSQTSGFQIGVSNAPISGITFSGK